MKWLFHAASVVVKFKTNSRSLWNKSTLKLIVISFGL